MRQQAGCTAHGQAVVYRIDDALTGVPVASIARDGCIGWHVDPHTLAPGSIPTVEAIAREVAWLAAFEDWCDSDSAADC